MSADDLINSPPHYNQGSVECIEALESIGIAKEYCQANVVKYLWRLGVKGNESDALNDALKARWYLNRLIGYFEVEAVGHDGQDED